MSHEIRTPMNGVMGMADLALESPTLVDSEREWVKTARDSAGSLLSILNDILDISKLVVRSSNLDTNGLSMGFA